MTVGVSRGALNFCAVGRKLDLQKMLNSSKIPLNMDFTSRDVILLFHLFQC